MLAFPSLDDALKQLDDSLGIRARFVRKRVPTHSLGYMLSGRPPPPQYRIEVVEERTEQWSKLIGILFCAPSSKLGKDEILPNLDYFHHRSAMFVDFFCVGFSRNASGSDQTRAKPVTEVDGVIWSFDPSDFNGCRAHLESVAKWRYSGEADLLLAVARKAGPHQQAVIDYSCAIACNLEAMLRDGAITSVRAFFEKLFQFGEGFKGEDPVWTLSDHFGIEGGGNLLKEAVLSVLPQTVSK